MAQTLQHSSYHHVRTSQHLVIAIILLCGLFLRIHYVDWNHDRMNAVIHTRLAGDEIGYDRCVRQLLTTGIYGYVPYG
ncbi:MAG: hypothetical protein ACM3ZQ_05885, partial [Bacillota bacterium]